MKVIPLLRLFGVFLLVLFAGFLIYTYLYFDYYVTDKDRLLNYKDQGIVLLDRNNEPYYFINNATNDEYTQLKNISEFVPQAVIAAEDKEFYKHFGVSPTGIVRSIILNLQQGNFSYGGSTLTQQFVKNALLSPQKSITRKVQEAVLALDVESKYKKDEILEMYLNTVYYGEGAIGINAAARTYFNKDPQQLTLSESAYLAGLLRYPSLLSPFSGDKELGRKSQEKVITKMKELNFITTTQAQNALKSPLAFKRGSNGVENTAPHFALMVVEKLKELYGNDVIYEGFKVKTTLDLALQEHSQSVVSENVAKNRHNGVSNGASVSIDAQTGEVIAYVGSANWFDERNGKVNMAATPRQPGSSFKPIVYSLAMDQGIITPATVLQDRPKTYVLDPTCREEGKCFYKPNNFDKKFRGRVTVRRALANSLNIPSVEIMDRLGIASLLANAPSFGITSLQKQEHYGKGLSLVLGSGEVSPLEMASAYTTFANDGNRPDVNFILQITDKFGRKVYEPKRKVTSVLSAESAYLVSSILSDNNTRSEQFGTVLTTPFPAAVKTGTTENYRDAWTIGYTPSLVTAVWVGNNDSRPINNLTGSLAAAPIWKQIMTKYVAVVGYENFEKPEAIIATSFCDPTSSGSARTEYFIDGTQPRGNCEKIRRRTTNVAQNDHNLPQIGGEQPSPTPQDPSTTNPPEPTAPPPQVDANVDPESNNDSDGKKEEEKENKD